MESPFGSELRRLRLEKGLSQQSLAEAGGVSQGMIGHLERGVSQDIQASTLYRLCRALGVGCDHFRPFLAGEEPSAKPPEPDEKPKKPKK